MNAESIFTQRSFSLIHMGHDHGLTAGARHRGRLVAVLCLSLSILAIEAVAAWLTSSLALLADAGHVLGDSLGIIMALAAITVAQAGKPGSRRTFGYQRTEVIAAGLNGLMLLVISGFVAYKAIGRIAAPPELDSAGPHCRCCRVGGEPDRADAVASRLPRKPQRAGRLSGGPG